MYQVTIRKDKDTRLSYDVPELLNVPGRTDILIHIGNKPEDTLGCILVGKSHLVDWVSDSKTAFNELMPRIEAALKEGELFINVV